MTASGQGDMEVYKVICLHAATIGYSPLIYELKPNVTFDKFLDILRSVWRSLESDPELPNKLVCRIEKSRSYFAFVHGCYS